MSHAKSPIKARLEKWGLKRMPFPTVPFVDPFNVDPIRNGSVFAKELRAEELEMIRRDVYQAGFPDLVTRWSWVWARRHVGTNIGMGKTAFFAYIADQINQDYGHTFFKPNQVAQWLAVHVTVSPKTRSVDELMAIALASICNDVRGMSVERLLLARLRHRVLTLANQTVNLRAPIIRFGQDRWLSDRGIDIPQLTKAIEAYLLDRGAMSDMGEAIARGSLRSYLQTLNGATSINPATIRLAKEATRLLMEDFARIAQATGILQVTFLLDDFYHLIRKTLNKDRPALASEIRTIAIDGSYFASQHNLYNWVAVMHTQTAPTFNQAWEQSDLHRIAPLQFHAKTGIALRRLSPEQHGPALLETYLNFQRPPHAPSGAYPFTYEGLQAISRLAIERRQFPGQADGILFEPRSLLELAFTVTRDALLQKDDPAPIGADYVEHVLLGKPLPEIDDSDDYVPPSEEATPLAIVCPCSCHDDEDEVAHDVIVLLAGGKDQDAPPAVIGHRCGACNMLVEIAH